jgi:uncharacterized membrane protein
MVFTFQHQYVLTVVVDPPDGGTVAPQTGWQNVGASVQVSAVANYGYTFAGGMPSGISCSNESSSGACTFVMPNNSVTLKATFTQNTQPTPTRNPPSLSLSTPQVSGLTITINGTALPGTPNTNVARINWGWGDGTSKDTLFPTAQTYNQTHTYSQPGTYTVTVTAYQSDGLSTVKIVSATVAATPTSTGPALLWNIVPAQTGPLPTWSIIAVILTVLVVALAVVKIRRGRARSHPKETMDEEVEEW